VALRVFEGKTVRTVYGLVEEEELWRMGGRDKIRDRRGRYCEIVMSVQARWYGYVGRMQNQYKRNLKSYNGRKKDKRKTM
jgi:hypothetical protein